MIRYSSQYEHWKIRLAYPDVIHHDLTLIIVQNVNQRLYDELTIKFRLQLNQRIDPVYILLESHTPNLIISNKRIYKHLDPQKIERSKRNKMTTTKIMTNNNDTTTLAPKTTTKNIENHKHKPRVKFVSTLVQNQQYKETYCLHTSSNESSE
jgi:hypothetical protein